MNYQYQTKVHFLEGKEIQGCESMSNQGWRMVTVLQPHLWNLEGSEGKFLIVWEKEQSLL